MSVRVAPAVESGLLELITATFRALGRNHTVLTRERTCGVRCVMRTVCDVHCVVFCGVMVYDVRCCAVFVRCCVVASDF